ncbi:MAG: hypothetical protein KC635_27045 [Myxococcales bacterium]|nr:hypothetical protein [Myxococcales bacterium]MCB9736984.1 hypothetical protein [Deltaproteobacteria bacterium]
MNILSLAAQAASMKGWPSQQQPSGELRVEVVTVPGRTQLVTISMAYDGDREPAAFIWSKAAEVNAKNDPWGLLRLNMQLTYGRVAVKGNDVIVLHAMLDRSSDITEVTKALYWVAKAADDLERDTYGAYADVL